MADKELLQLVTMQLPAAATAATAARRSTRKLLEQLLNSTHRDSSRQQKGLPLNMHQWVYPSYKGRSDFGGINMTRLPPGRFWDTALLNASAPATRPQQFEALFRRLDR